MNYKKTDMFSGVAGGYSRFRPDYPPILYDTFLKYVNERELAWDAATGNGQVARVLSQSFERVIASDISEKQLDCAPRISNVSYQVFSAEAAPIPSNSVDCTTVAQAAHWFEFRTFCSEVERVSKIRCCIGNMDLRPV